MKMMSIKMAMLVAGVGFAGYIYLKHNPQMMNLMKNMMKDMGKDVSRQMHNKFDSEM